MVLIPIHSHLLLLLLSCSVVSDSLQPHGLQHASFPVFHHLMSIELVMPSIISSSVIPFCPQSFQAPGSFPVSRLFASDGQYVGASASASVLPMNVQSWFPLGWTGWILAVQGTLKSLLQHHSSKASVLWQCPLMRCSAAHWLIHTHIKFRMLQTDLIILIIPVPLHEWCHQPSSCLSLWLGVILDPFFSPHISYIAKS